MSEHLELFLTPIYSGLSLQVPPSKEFALDGPRAAKLHRQLAGLARARHQAAVASRSYPVGGGS